MSSAANVTIKIERRKGRAVKEETMAERVLTDFAVGNVEIGASIGHTIGLPNYSSFRVDVSMKMSTKPGLVDEVSGWQEEWCKQRCSEIIEAEGIHK